MSDLTDIIARLEKCTGPDRELDKAVFEAACLEELFAQYKAQSWFCSIDCNSFGFNTGGEPPVIWCGALPRYTASIEAALTLVPEGYAWQLRRNVSADGDMIYCNAQVWQFSNPRDEETAIYWSNSHESAPAIALCIAIFKARQQTTSLPIPNVAQGEQERT